MIYVKTVCSVFKNNEDYSNNSRSEQMFFFSNIDIMEKESLGSIELTFSS